MVHFCRMPALFALVVAWSGSGCASLGPHPEIVISQSETKATRTASRIMILPTLGTGTPDADSPLNKAVPAGIYDKYGDSVLLANGFANTLKTLKMPPEVLPALTASWQAAFAQWIASLPPSKVPAESALRLSPPQYGKKVARTDKDLGRLSSAIKKRQKKLDPVIKAAKGHDPGALVKAVEDAGKALQPVNNLLAHLVSRLDVTYLVASQWTGSEKDFEGGKLMTLHVAMVHTRTGMVRYYGRSVGKKGDAPTDYEGLYIIMAQNMMEDLKDSDSLEF